MFDGTFLYVNIVCFDLGLFVFNLSMNFMHLGLIIERAL